MLVGRDDILVEARNGLTSARGGSGGALLLCGEPGIGKTRLAQEITHTAVEDGFKVLWASCWDGGGSPALWPWIQVLRAFAASTEAASLREIAGRAASDLARIVPGFGGIETPPPIADSSPEDQFRLFDTVSSFLERAATRQPLCMVVDDVQWADPSSLELLRFLGSRLAGSAIYLLAARRSNEPEPGPAAASLDELATSTPTMELHGLTQDEVAALFKSVTGMAPPDPLVSAVHTRSGGNPLFVRELARLLVAQGDSAGEAMKLPAMPAAVQSVIARRLGFLSPECRSVLEVAAVVGVEFDARLAERAASNHDRLGSASLAEAAKAGVVLRPAPPSHVHRFAHGIVRDVIYASIEPERQARLHRYVATELEATPGSHPDEMLEHFERAGTPDDLERALGFAEAAAEGAYDRLAFTEAAAIARRGLGLAERLGIDDERRLRLLLRCSNAMNRTGSNTEARPLFLEAADIARRSGDTTGLADAALGYGFLLQSKGLGGMALDPELKALLEDAIAAVPPDSARGVLTRWRLALELSYVDPDTAERIAEECLQGARSTTDPTALGLALELKSQLNYHFASPALRLEIATEIYTIGRTHSVPEVEMTGHVRRLIALLELGDIAEVDQEIAVTERLISDARLRVDRWYPALWRAMRALLDGRIEEAEKLAGEALMAGEVQGQGAIDHYGMQLMALRREQGRMGEITDLIQDGAERYPEIPAYRCSLAMAYAESGQMALAQAELDLLAADRFAVVRCDYNWTVSMMCLSIACVLLDDGPKAEILLDLWRGSEEQFVFVGYGAICGGAVSHYMGTLAATAGREIEAISYLEDALERNRAAGATLWTVRSETALGRLLADRDPERSADLLARARATASELGLVAAMADLDTLGEPSAPEPVEPSVVAEGDVFRRDGEMWTLTFDSETVHVRDAKGMRDLATLLGSPDQEIHALQLYSEGGPAPAAVVTDEVIDARAASEYRSRITDLQEEIDDAEAMSDVARAEQARIELDALTETLASAYGLAGRPRKAPADPGERARKAVTARVRDGIKRIADVHPSLGAHLDRSIKTGTFLSYAPDREVRWAM